MDAQRLATFLAAVEPVPASVSSCRPLPGGYSRTTVLAEITWGDGRVEEVVLRGDPAPGSGVFRSDRDAEWSLLQALSAADAVKVPRPRWYDGTGALLGSKCLVSERVQGGSLHQLLSAGADVDRGRDLFVAALASVHAVPLSVLPDGLVPDVDGEEHLDRLVDVVEELSRRATGSSPFLRHVAATLRRHRPAPVPLTLVHGDWQPGNVLVPEQGPPHVIDWEFARVGDPREDLGYYLQIPMEPHLYRHDPDGYLARYREHTGLSEEQVNPDVMPFFLVVGTARILGQLLDAADAVAAGQPRGTMAVYLLNAVSYFSSLYLDACRRLTATTGAPR